MEKKIAYGPAMLALSAAERKFVHGLYEHDNNFARAVAGAGLEGKPAELESYGRAWALQDNIQAAIKELQPLYVTRAIPQAQNALIDVMVNSLKGSERTAASKELMAMAGLGGKQEITVKHEYTINSPEFFADAKAYAQKIGVDPRKLLGSRADIEDAEVVREYDPDEEF